MREKLIDLLKEIGVAFPISIANFLAANDVVPVVRCKDCKSYNGQDELADIAGWTDGEPYCFCEEMMEYVPRKGFCHKGERKYNG